MKRTSHSMSSSVTLRPSRASNSWRLTPRSTIRSPLTVKMPCSISTWRNPTTALEVSTSRPSASRTSTSTRYRFGSSALHARTSAIAARPRSTASSADAACRSTSSVVSHNGMPVPSSTAHTRTSALCAAASPSSASRRSSTPHCAATSQSAVACMSRTCTRGRTSRRTPRNSPWKRQQSWSSSQLALEYWKHATASVLPSSPSASVTSNSLGVYASSAYPTNAPLSHT